MTQEFDPYDVLGVDPGADDATIKGAYRGAAKRSHPDAQGGTREAWDSVERAYLLLTDQRRRARYDRTGYIDDDHQADDMNAAAAQALENVFLKIVNDCLVKPETNNVEQMDVIKIMRHALAAEIAFEIATRDEAHGTLKIVEKMRKRVRMKKRGNNLLDHVLANRAKLLGSFISNSERAQAIRERAIELLQAYEYDFDKAPDGWSTGKGISASDLLALQKQMKTGGGPFVPYNWPT